MSTSTEENYLKTLLALSANGNDKVSVSDLAKALGISTPSANSMVKKLADRNLLVYEKYKPLELTTAGRKAAALIVRKHRLTEMFLVEKMGFGWEEVHEIAEQIEHVDSPGFFTRMDELMGHPTVDPHGSPIPDAEGNIITKNRRRLSECGAGETVAIVGLDHNSNEFLHFLNDRSLGLGTILRVHHREAFDGSLTLSYPGHERVTLSKVVAERLLIVGE